MLVLYCADGGMQASFCCWAAAPVWCAAVRAARQWQDAVGQGRCHAGGRLQEQPHELPGTFMPSLTDWQAPCVTAAAAPHYVGRWCIGAAVLAQPEVFIAICRCIGHSSERQKLHSHHR